MKNRTLLFAALVAGICIAVAFWLKARRPSPDTSSTTPSIRSAGIQDATLPTAASQAPSPSSTARQPTETVPPKEQRREVINAWENAREKEVEFWGKVIDQHDEPIVGVAVTATVTTHKIPPSDFRPEPTTVYSAATDANGIFYIKGRAGRGFTIETMKKTGYVVAPELQKRTGNLFWYNYDQLDAQGFKPDPNFPTVFRMWKIGHPEKLIAHDRDTRIPYDGTTVAFDLLTGEQVQNGGDIRVSLLRTPQQINRGQQRFDWTATVEAVGGGVLESNDDFMYLAPEAGYLAKLNIVVAASDPNWSPGKKVSFFLKSREGGNFGRVTIEFMTDSEKPKTGFSFYSVVNPSGSRNLEFDPAKAITPKP